MITKEKWEMFRSVSKIQGEIEEHITKALQEIFKIYNGELKTWFYPGASEGGMGEMRVWDNSIPIETQHIKDISYEAWHEDEGYSGYLTCEFPVHFLFLDVEEIKNRVMGFKKQFEKQEQLEKQAKAKKQKDNELKKKKLIKAATKKLTAEERKVLGI